MNHDSIQVPASISDTLKHHHLISGYGSRLTGAARHPTRTASPRAVSVLRMDLCGDAFTASTPYRHRIASFAMRPRADLERTAR